MNSFSGWIVLLTACIGLSSCSRGEDAVSGASWSPEGEVTRTIAVEGMTATKSRLVEEIRGAGIAEGAKEVWVVSETEGLIREVDFDYGDRVEAGQILLTVDSDLAERNRDSAEQRYATAALEFQAAEKFLESGSISELEYSRLRDALLAAEAARAAAVDAYVKTRIAAPFAGAVAFRDGNVGIGSFLSRGVRVAKIIDDSRFRAEIGVGEGQVLLIEEGAPAEITGNDGRVREGTVAAVSAGSDDATGSFTVVVEWVPGENDPLRSGMSVRISIKAKGSPERIIAPASAIRTRGGTNFLYVDSGGTAELREIRTGSRLGDRIEVLEGLAEGETVLTSGLASLTPGAPIEVTPTGETGEAR